MSVLEYSEKFGAYVGASPKNVHPCKVCSYFTTSFFLMVNHVRRHRSSLIPLNCEKTDIEIYWCKECHFQTKLTLLFRRHIENCHGAKRKNDENPADADYTIKNYICEKCSFKTHFLIEWGHHTTECLRSQENYQITTIKDYVNNVIATNKYDQNGKHLKKSTEQEIKWYTCKKCQFKTKHKSSFNYHKNVHLDEWDIKWYECESYPYKTKKSADLKKHVNARHSDEKGITWYECQQCSYKAKSADTLQHHIHSHHLDEKDVKWWKCKKCLFKTKRRFTLNQHINMRHSSEQDDIKWYACKKCQFKTKHRSSLKYHKNVHLDEHDIKWYQCKSCPYKTKQNSSLKKTHKCASFG